MDNNKPLYNNIFMENNELKDLDPEVAKDFKDYYESLNDEKRKKLVLDRLSKKINPMDNSDLLITNQFISKDPNGSLSLGFNEYIPDEFLPFDLQKNKYNNDRNIFSSGVKRTKKTVYPIDSRDRNISDISKPIYKNSNDFKIKLDRVYKNIKQIKLISSEFPNADQAVKNSPLSLKNNRITWINQEDSVSGFPTYSVDIQPGNYTASTLTDEMKNKMNKVLKTQNNKNHFFDVQINLDTDIVKIYNIDLSNLPINPVNSIANNNTITIYQPNNSFSVNDTIFLSGVKGFVGGIPPSKFNDYHTIISTTLDNGSGGFGPMVINELNNALDFRERDSANTNLIAVVTKSIYDSPNNLASALQSSLNDAGDQSYNVTFSINTFIISSNGNVDLLWNSGSNRGISIGNDLGFNTSIDLILSNTYTANVSIPQSTLRFHLDIQATTTDVGGGNGVRSGELLPFKFLFGSNTGVIANLLGYPSEDSSDIFSDSAITTFAGPISDASIITSPATAIKITSVNHNLITGDIVILRNLVAVPNLATSANIAGTGFQTIFTITKIDNDNFSVPYSQVTEVNPEVGNPSWGSSKIQITHTSHGFSSGDFIKIYRLPNVGGYSGDSINNYNAQISVVDPNTYTFDFTGNFASLAETKTNNTIRISAFNPSSTLYGFSGLQDNTSNGSVLFKEINLDGEDYIYLTCPQLNTINTSDGSVKNKFAKILLTGVPGTKIYDSFVSNPKTFDTAPLDRLDELEFQVKRYDNEFFNFNGLDFSFSLEIEEYIDEIPHTAFSSRRGVREVVNPSV